jgi:hypothetical protein
MPLCRAGGCHVISADVEFRTVTLGAARPIGAERNDIHI